MTSPRDPPDGAGSTASPDRCVESNAISPVSRVSSAGFGEGAGKEGVSYFTLLMGMTRRPPIMAQMPAM